MSSDPPGPGAPPARGPLDFDAGDAPRSAPGSAVPPPPPRHARAAGGPGPSGRVRLPRGPVWFLGAAGVVLLIIVTLNSIRTGGAPPGLAAGARLPEFAAPLATSRFPAGRDAVDLADGGGDACRLRGPEVLNLCALRDRGPVVLAFFATDGVACGRDLDALDRLRGRYPQLGIAAVAVRAERGQALALVRRHRWGFPVAYDADGRLAARYRVVTCPQFVFARQGGRVVRTTFRGLSAAELDPLLRSLAQGR